MLPSLRYIQEIVSKRRHIVTVEVKDYYGVKKIQMNIEIELGKKPTIGDFHDMLLRELQIDMEIKAFTPYLEFKPKHPVTKGIQYAHIKSMLPA